MSDRDTSNPVDDDILHHIPQRGRTRKTELNQNLTQEVDRLKKNLKKGRTQCDPLYDRLKKFHDRLAKEVSNTTTEKLATEVLDVVSNATVIGDCDRQFWWTKDDEDRLNRLNVEVKSLQSRTQWTWGGTADTLGHEMHGYQTASEDIANFAKSFIMACSGKGSHGAGYALQPKAEWRNRENTAGNISRQKE
jgi:hypothetical protein